MTTESKIQKNNPTSNQVFGYFTATIVKNKTNGLRAAKLNRHGKLYAYVPLEIVSHAAGKDTWMRDIKIRCLDCRKVGRIGDTECELCQDCYDKSTAENSQANS